MTHFGQGKELLACVQRDGPDEEPFAIGTHFACFTSTEVQILTKEEQRSLQPQVSPRRIAGTQVSCLTSTTVPILTQHTLQVISTAQVKLLCTFSNSPAVFVPFHAAAAADAVRPRKKMTRVTLLNPNHVFCDTPGLLDM